VVFQIDVYHMTDIHNRPQAALSRLSLKANNLHLSANLANRSAFSPACRLRSAGAQRMLYIFDFYGIDKQIFFTEARFRNADIDRDRI
jgi:hypothetical protein